jgi:hypothetical protein
VETVAIEHDHLVERNPRCEIVSLADLLADRGALEVFARTHKHLVVATVPISGTVPIYGFHHLSCYLLRLRLRACLATLLAA